MATPEPQGEEQVRHPHPSYAPAQGDGGRNLYRETEMRVSELQVRQRVERDRMYGYTQPHPYTQPYPPSYAHTTYAQHEMRGYATSGNVMSAQTHPYGGNTARSGQPLGYSQNPDFNPIGTYMPSPFQNRGVPSREREREFFPFHGNSSSIP